MVRHADISSLLIRSKHCENESGVCIYLGRLYVSYHEIYLECVLCHVTGVQNENKSALINPPSWIFPGSVVYKMSWGEFNLPYKLFHVTITKSNNQSNSSFLGERRI